MAENQRGAAKCSATPGNGSTLPLDLEAYAHECLHAWQLKGYPNLVDELVGAFQFVAATPAPQPQTEGPEFYAQARKDAERWAVDTSDIMRHDVMRLAKVFLEMSAPTGAQRLPDMETSGGVTREIGALHAANQKTLAAFKPALEEYVVGAQAETGQPEWREAFDKFSGQIQGEYSSIASFKAGWEAAHVQERLAAAPSELKIWKFIPSKRSNSAGCNIMTPEGNMWQGFTAEDAGFICRELNKRERELAAAPQADHAPAVPQDMLVEALKSQNLADLAHGIADNIVREVDFENEDDEGFKANIGNVIHSRLASLTAPAQPDLAQIREALAPTPPPLLVWWVSQDAQEQMGDSAGRMLRNCPDYIKNEFRSRSGRPGRGRLWVPKHLGDVVIDPWPETECSKAAENCGGIVVEGIHYKHVCKLPGFVTDLGLNLYEPREPDIEAALAALAAPGNGRGV